MDALVMRGFSDELVKISKAPVPPGFLKRYGKAGALIGAGAAGLYGVQRLGKDIRVGEAYRKQMKEQG
jgi:hypothetical protein